MNSKKIFIFGAIVAMASVCIPVLAIDENASTTPPAPKTVCEKAVDLSLAVSEKLSGQKTQLEQIIQERLNGINAKRSEIQDKLSQFREKWSENREQRFAKLEARAKDDIQKQAVAKFKGAVQGAIASRQTEIDVARADFRTSFDQIWAQRKDAVNKAVSDYKTAVEAVYAKAKTDCQAKVATKTIIANVRLGLKKARQNFQTAKKAIAKFSAQTAPLVATRNAAIKDAQDKFKEAISQAEAELKTAFGEQENPSQGEQQTP